MNFFLSIPSGLTILSVFYNLIEGIISQRAKEIISGWSDVVFPVSQFISSQIAVIFMEIGLDVSWLFEFLGPDYSAMGFLTIVVAIRTVFLFDMNPEKNPDYERSKPYFGFFQFVLGLPLLVFFSFFLWPIFYAMGIFIPFMDEPEDSERTQAQVESDEKGARFFMMSAYVVLTFLGAGYLDLVASGY